jgi:hypothetical protein
MSHHYSRNNAPMPHRSPHKYVNTDRYRALHNVTDPKVGDTVMYIGKYHFLKTDRKPRAVILAVHTNNRYDIELLINGVKLYYDLSERVPFDGDYNHYRHLIRA